MKDIEFLNEVNDRVVLSVDEPIYQSTERFIHTMSEQLELSPQQIKDALDFQYLARRQRLSGLIRMRRECRLCSMHRSCCRHIRASMHPWSKHISRRRPKQRMSQRWKHQKRRQRKQRQKKRL